MGAFHELIKGLLNDIRCLGFVSENAVTSAKDHGSVTMDDGGKGRVIAMAHEALKECLIRLFHRIAFSIPDEPQTVPTF